MNTLVRFHVQSVTPDPRPYMQQRQLYVPVPGFDVVGVVIEVNPKNFVLPEKWFEQMTLWELGQGEKPTENFELIFTPAGWAYVMSQLEEPYTSRSSSEAESFFEDVDKDF